MVILAAMALLLVALIGLLVLDSITSRAMEDRHRDISRLMEVNKLEVLGEKSAVMRTMLDEPRMRQYAAAWSTHMSNLEMAGEYAARDQLFREAMKILGPEQMLLFLRINRESVFGYKAETIAAAQKNRMSLPPLIQLTQSDRDALFHCDKLLNDQISRTRAVVTGSLEDESILVKVKGRMSILYPDLFYTSCEL